VSCLTVKITDTITGDSRLFSSDMEWYGDYIWSEGNFSCDCNRYLFFQRALNMDEDGESPCGDDRYTIDSIFHDGKIVYTEMDATTEAGKGG